MDGDCDDLMAEVKLSMGFASGGDIRLEIGGSRVIVVKWPRVCDYVAVEAIDDRKAEGMAEVYKCTRR